MPKRGNKQTKSTSQKTRVVTAPVAQALRHLAERIGKIISLTGYRSSFSLTVIAKDKGLSRYLPQKTSKKEAIFEFLKNLYRYRPRTTKKLVREILPKAIEQRHAKGDPVLESEALELIRALEALGIDMKEEILALNLPKERPRVVPPPVATQKILDAYTLHAVLLPDCKTMFVGGHMNESVRKALERFEKTVQDISGSTDKIGSNLMAYAFDEKDPKITVADIATQQGKSKQLGFKLVCMGLMSWWRNNLSHGDEQQIPHHDALSRLIMISNLFHELDNRIT